MPTADTFTTLGVFNGFPSCVAKVDVSSYDKWTTLGGFNKDSGGVPTSAQVRDSHKIAVRLYWNLYRVTCETGDVSVPSSILSEVIVSGWDAPNEAQEPEPIQPNERGCSGSLTRGGDLLPILADVDLRLSTGIVRMYNKSNFVGYGLGLIDWDNAVQGEDLAPIAQWVIDVFVDPQSLLGGYSNDDVSSGILYEYTYVVRDGIHMLWLGSILLDSELSPGLTTHIDSATLRAWLEDGGSPSSQAQITGLEFYTYP